MGAWGTGNFDNDTAADWAYELEESSDLSVVEASLDAALSEDYLDSDIGCEALAAAEVVARLKGQFGTRNSYTESVDKWVDQHKLEPSPTIVNKAKDAIGKVLAENSELNELWEESEDGTAWREEVEALRSRLNV